MTPFVGREPERHLLLERWSLAQGGEGQTIMLSGEAGIGKFRMVQAGGRDIDKWPVIDYG
jgi:predicted ATPase